MVINWVLVLEISVRGVFCFAKRTYVKGTYIYNTSLVKHLGKHLQFF